MDYSQIDKWSDADLLDERFRLEDGSDDGKIEETEENTKHIKFLSNEILKRALTDDCCGEVRNLWGEL